MCVSFFFPDEGMEAHFEDTAWTLAVHTVYLEGAARLIILLESLQVRAVQHALCNHPSNKTCWSDVTRPITALRRLRQRVSEL